MASISDQYEQASQCPKSTQNILKNPLITSSGFISMQLEENTPIFSKQKMNFNPSDSITHMAISNDNLVLAMANHKIFRVDLKNPEAQDVTGDISISKYIANGTKLNNIYLDPLGVHLLISLVGKSPENYPDLLYLNKKSSKIKSVGKSKIYEITEVGWNFENTSESTTGTILLGTSKGLIIETEICPDADKMFQSGIEQYWRQLPNYFPNYANKDLDGLAFDIGKCVHTPITGIEFRKCEGTNNYFIFVTTSKKLYQFIGSANPDDKSLLQPIFNTYLNVPESDSKLCPSTWNYSNLQFFCHKNSTYPNMFGWLTENGIYHGKIEKSFKNNTKSVINQDKTILFPKVESVNDNEKKKPPLSFVLTEFHSLILYEDQIRGLSNLNDEIVYEDVFPESMGKLINIAKDPIKHTIWVITQKAVFRYKTFKEHRNVWQIYADNNEFDLAKKYCENNPAHLDKVFVKQAELLFREKEYNRSAEIFANTQSTFEGVCLKFLDAKQIDALKVYLNKKLEVLKPSDKIQTTMLVVWMIELYLSQLAQLRYSERQNTEEYIHLQRKFETFLLKPNITDCVKRNKSVIYDLMSSHGDKDNLIKLTIINKDFENVIRQHIYKKAYADALNVLKSESKRDLFYQFAPILMQEIPEMLVSALIEQGRNLNPTKLLPALVSCETDHVHVKEMIKYLEFCVKTLGCTDQPIHNYLLSLYVGYDTKSLMEYLALQGHTTRTVNYDVHYALRLCREKNLTEACVQLSSILELWESAVDLALGVDIELAKKIADMVEDLELKRNLWLKIAQFVINGKQDIQQAMNFLQECELIKIEDILPFFSDFVTIDHFREPICNSLQEYNQQIQDLREEMEEATRSADQVRLEIQTFRNRCAVISVSEVCTLCEITLLIRPFYLFPCGHKFHTDCLMNEIQPLLGPAKQNILATLNRQLNSFFNPTEVTEDLLTGKQNTKEQIKYEIDNILASECLYCGEYMIRAIDTPFISDKDWDRVMKEWE